MTLKSQKILLIAGVSAFGLLLLYMLVNNLLFAPLAEADKNSAKLRQDIAGLQNIVKDQGKLKQDSRLKEVASRMIGGTEQQVSVQLASTVQGLLDACRLGDRMKSAQPISAKNVEPCYREVGLAIQVKGRLGQIVNFLYLLDAQTFIHRIDKIILNRDAGSGEVDLTVNYSTLVFNSKDKKVPTTLPSSQPFIQLQLDTDLRKSYNAIVSRDLMRPFVKRIIDPAQPAAEAKKTTPPDGVSSPAQAGYRLCGLARWQDGSEDITFVNPADQGDMRQVKIGQSIGNAEVVMMDFRPMPLTSESSGDASGDSPPLMSTGRLIVKVDQKYYAIEVGQRLADKHQLQAEQLPMELRAPESQPVTATDATAPAELTDKSSDKE
jgi:hypothetical protein